MGALEKLRPSSAGWFAVGAGVLAALYLVLLTPNSVPRFTPDSAAYIGATENIADGHGATLPFVPRDTDDRPLKEAAYRGEAPLYQYSPGYPLLLAGPVAAGISIRSAAHVVNVLCFGLSAALIAWGALRLTRRSFVAAALALFLVVTTSVWVIVFRFITTEVVFVTLCLASVGIIARYVVAPNRWLGAALVVTAAMASMTRFTGVGVIGTGAVAILAWGPGSFAKRVLRAGAITGLALLPITIWMFRDALSASGGAGALSFHPPDVFGGFTDHAAEFLDGSYTTTWPIGAKTLALVAIVAFAALGACRGLRRPAARGGEVGGDGRRDALGTQDRSLLRVAVTFVVVYLTGLFASMTFFHGAPFNARYLLPVLPIMFVLAVAGVWEVVRLFPRGWPHHLAAAGAAVLVLAVSISHLGAAIDGWTPARTYRDVDPSPPGSAFAALRDLPRGDIVFTNAPDAVYLASGHFGIPLPSKLPSIWTKEPRTHYHADLAEVGAALCRQPGVVLVVGGAFAMLQMVPTTKASHLKQVRSYPDGTILKVDASSCADSKR